MSTNPFVALRKLLPPSPVWIGKVLAHHEEDDTSTVELPTRQGIIPYAGAVQAGAIIRARGRTVPVGQNAFVRDGVIENRAPDGEPTDILIGKVIEKPAALAFVGPIPDQTLTLAAPFLLALDPYWTGGYLPRSWSLVSGTLPTGLSLNPATGAVTGTVNTSVPQADVVFRCTDYLSNVADGSVRFLALEASQDAGGAMWDVTYSPSPHLPSYTNGGFNALLPGVTASLPGSGNTMVTRTGVPLTGKLYCEFEIVTQTNDLNYHAFGIYRTSTGNPVINGTGNVQFFSRAPTTSGGCGLGADGTSINGALSTSTAYAFAPGDRMGVAVDATLGHVWVRKNGGAWIGGGNPATGTTPSFTFTPAADWVFSHVSYTCNAAGTQVNARIFPTAALQATPAPAGFVPYAASTVVPTASTLYALNGSTLRSSTNGGQSWTTLGALPAGTVWNKLTRTSTGWLLTSEDYVNFGPSHVAYSTNLSTWTVRTDSSLLGDPGNDFGAPMYAAVAQGASRLLVWNSEAIDNSAWGSFSTNGGTSFAATTFSTWRFQLLLWSRRLQLFVAAEGNLVATSPDGNTWTLRHTGPSGVRYEVGVETANGLLLFNGTSGDSVIRSTNGTSWAQVSGASWGDTVGAAADGMRVLSGRRSGELWRSADGGVTWSELTSGSGLPSAVEPRRPVWGGDAFYLMSGGAPHSSTQTLWRSLTGATWTQVGTLPSGDHVWLTA